MDSPVLRTLLLFLAATAVVMVVVGVDRRADFGPDDAEAAALDWGERLSAWSAKDPGGSRSAC